MMDMTGFAQLPAQLLGLEPGALALVVLTALLIGFSKTGIGGVVMIVVPLMAATFGGKTSTGIILPMLITGDIFAVAYYHRHADWPGIRRLLPWVLAGLGLGLAVGNLIDDRQFTLLIAISLMICLGILVAMELRAGQLRVPEGQWFYALIGMIAGLTTMIGNVAGPIFAVYLLARRFDKHGFLGTSAWFFMIVNVTKLPLQVFFWGNITLNTALLSAAMIPFVLVGAILGAMVIKRIPEKPFRWLVIVMTAIAIVRLIFF